MSDLEICFLTATELGRRLRAKDLSAREVVAAHLRQIGRLNPDVNALITLTAEQARAAAQEADDRLARGEGAGPLHGLPVAHKDLQESLGCMVEEAEPDLSGADEAFRAWRAWAFELRG
jgi:amidase